MPEMPFHPPPLLRCQIGDRPPNSSGNPVLLSRWPGTDPVPGTGTGTVPAAQPASQPLSVHEGKVTVDIAPGKCAWVLLPPGNCCFLSLETHIKYKPYFYFLDG